MSLHHFALEKPNSENLVIPRMGPDACAWPEATQECIMAPTGPTTPRPQRQAPRCRWPRCWRPSLLPFTTSASATWAPWSWTWRPWPGEKKDSKQQITRCLTNQKENVKMQMYCLGGRDSLNILILFRSLVESIKVTHVHRLSCWTFLHTVEVQ